MTTRIEVFPADYEALLVLEEVRADDKIVYFESCACLPLRDRIAEKTRERGQLVIIGSRGVKESAAEEVECREGTYEKVPVEDNWATLAIGECSLDEFKDSKQAVSELWRILAPGGKILLSGPVGTDDEVISRASIVEFLTLDKTRELLREAGFVSIKLVDLTPQVLERLARSHYYRKFAETMVGMRIMFVFAKATKVSSS